MKIESLESILKSNAYPGRGIVVGKSADSKRAIASYWTMGRSTGSRNRVFAVEKADDGTEIVKTKAFDESIVAGDPSLIIYAAVRQFEKKHIVTNGDQTDTIFEGFKKGLSFEQSLKSRKYEHDAPNFTPRISAVLDFEGGKFDFCLSILKSDAGNPDSTLRQTFEYENPRAGIGRFIHTYKGDGNPLPSFCGEPVAVEISGTLDEFAERIWNALNEENKVSLFVREIDIESGKFDERVFNKNC